MENKTLVTILIVVLVLLVGFGAWYVMNYPNPITDYMNNNTTENNNQNDNNQNQAKGTLYFTVTDAAANMQNVTAVNMAIDRLEVFSNTQGWITLSTTPQIFNLLELKAKNQSKLFVKSDVAADTYSQLRLHVTKVLVMESGQIKEAKLPSNELKMQANIVVNSNTNSVARVDMLVDKSLHKTGNGNFIFAPVVKLDSSSDVMVQVGSENIVMASGGTVHSSIHGGMNLDGQMMLNFQLDQNTDFHINGAKIEAILK